MKKVKALLQKMDVKIKKKFFNKGSNKMVSTGEKLQEMEEYLRNYSTTTRWQTV